MDPITIVFGVVAAGAGAVAVWLLIGKGKVQAELAAAATRAERAEGDLGTVRAEVEKREARTLEWREKSESLGLRISVLEGELEKAAQQHTDELRHAQEILAEQLKAVEGRERQLREEMRERDAQAKEEAAKRDAQMKETFRALSAETLSKSAQDFLKLAEQKLVQQQQAGAAELDKRHVAFAQLIKPVTETLAKTDAKLGEIEKERLATVSTLNEQIRGMAEANLLLKDETGKLVRALREPHVRGRYGELQLKRVAELAGMSAYCDFAEQDSTVGEDGAPLRPDMVVRMPSARVVVVDAKTNIQGYLDALQAATPEEADRHLDRFARHVGEQATALSRKKYWTQYEGSPEFVVMFIPGDQFIDAALSRQPEILEAAARQNVLLAGPATLIGLLRAVHVGYTEQKLAASAEELRRLGIEFHERAAVAFKHIADLGGSIERTVELYNKFVGSYQTRLEPTLKRFEEEGAKSGKELPEVGDVTVRPRQGLLGSS